MQTMAPVNLMRESRVRSRAASCSAGFELSHFVFGFGVLGLIADQRACERFGNLGMIVHLGRLLDDRLRMRDVRLGIGDGLLLYRRALSSAAIFSRSSRWRVAAAAFAVCSSSRAASASAITV